MKIEFIESYIKLDDGDYKWNDNHGELIRCKDCKHWDVHKRLGIPWCRELHIDRSERDFCSDGERRESDE